MVNSMLTLQTTYIFGTYILTINVKSQQNRKVQIRFIIL